MPSKLGIHCLTPTQTARDMIDAGAQIVKLVNDFGLAEYAISKGALVIGRHVTNYPDDPGRRVTAENLRHLAPQDAARLWVALQTLYYDANPLILLWEGPNEPVWSTPDDMRWYAEFEIERMRLLNVRGLKAVVGNFSTGNPDLSLWSSFLPALRVANDLGHYFGLHEYGGVWMWWMTGPYQIDRNVPFVRDEGWTTLRYRKIYRQFLAPAGIGDLRLIITECGLDRISPTPPGFDTFGGNSFSG